MVTRTIPQNPERAAWTVLLGSFLTFVILTSSAVFGSSYWLRNASVSQSITPVYSGTVLVTRPGRTAPEAGLQDIPVESTIATEANGQASLTFTAGNGQRELATVQVFGNSNVRISIADSPRFSRSQHPHRIVLNVLSGRVRVFAGVDLDRPLVIEVRSDPGALTVVDTPGSNAEVEATFTESMVTVREGQAAVTAVGTTVTVGKDQRVQVVAGTPPSQPQPAERNLVRNGDFSAVLDGDWRIELSPPANPNESQGDVHIIVVGGRRTAQFQRLGNDWGQVSIVQNIDRDIQGYSTLRLHMDVYIAAQDLHNCGQFGTECPLMAKITYVDIYGAQREWLKGFFYNYSLGSSFGYTFCVTCSPNQWEHERWPKGKWQIFDSENLLPVFAKAGAQAASIKSIILYASGHTFTSFVTDIQLLAD